MLRGHAEVTHDHEPASAGAGGTRESDRLVCGISRPCFAIARAVAGFDDHLAAGFDEGWDGTTHESDAPLSGKDLPGNADDHRRLPSRLTKYSGKNGNDFSVLLLFLGPGSSTGSSIEPRQSNLAKLALGR